MFQYFSEDSDRRLFYCSHSGAGGIRGYREYGPSGKEVPPSGKHGIRRELVRKLDQLRIAAGRPLTITSGYRHATHPVEARKAKPGRHTRGDAADILVLDAQQRYELVRLAIELGFKGIGVARTFVHVDLRREERLWEYSKRG